MRAVLLAVPGLVLGGLMSVSGGTAVAAEDARTTVTIEAEGTDVRGTVLSPKPKKCLDGRKVLVMKQKGAKGGDNDTKVGMDNASVDGDVGYWFTGNPGMTGKFYAKVKKIDGCKGDTSKTITIQQPTASRAADPVKTVLTIQSGSGAYLFGQIKSPKPAKCIVDRKILVMKQVKKQGGSDDKRTSTTTAFQEGEDWYWSGNGEVSEGKYYAKVKATNACKGDTTESIKVLPIS